MQFPILCTYWHQYCSLWRQHWRTFHFIKRAWLSVAYLTARVWTLTVDILNTICNHDCFGDCSLDLTLIVSFWKIAFLVCHWKQIISRSWNWTHWQFSTQCSNGCRCVLRNFQWFLFHIMSVTVLYLRGGGAFFGIQCISQKPYSSRSKHPKDVHSGSNLNPYFRKRWTENLHREI